MERMRRPRFSQEQKTELWAERRSIAIVRPSTQPKSRRACSSDSFRELRSAPLLSQPMCGTALSARVSVAVARLASRTSAPMEAAERKRRREVIRSPGRRAAAATAVWSARAFWRS